MGAEQMRHSGGNDKAFQTFVHITVTPHVCVTQSPSIEFNKFRIDLVFAWWFTADVDSTL
jgi:hypothetical protein